MVILLLIAGNQPGRYEGLSHGCCVTPQPLVARASRIEACWLLAGTVSLVCLSMLAILASAVNLASSSSSATLIGMTRQERRGRRRDPRRHVLVNGGPEGAGAVDWRPRRRDVHRNRLERSSWPGDTLPGRQAAPRLLRPAPGHACGSARHGTCLSTGP